MAISSSTMGRVYVESAKESGLGRGPTDQAIQESYTRLLVLSDTSLYSRMVDAFKHRTKIKPQVFSASPEENKKASGKADRSFSKISVASLFGMLSRVWARLAGIFNGTKNDTTDARQPLLVPSEEARMDRENDSEPEMIYTRFPSI